MKFRALLEKFDRTLPAVSVDFETYYDDECSVRGSSYYGYTRHPKFDPYLVAIYSEELGIDYVGHPKNFHWPDIDGCIWLAHNAAFDEIVYDSMVDHLNWMPRGNPHCWVDTAALSSYLGAPRNLAGASLMLLKRKRDKAVRSDMKGKKFSDVSAQEQARWIEYARTDAVDCYELWTKFGDRWPDREILLAIHTVRCIKRGVYVDLPAIRKDYQTVKTAVQVAEKLIPWAGELVYTKTGKVKTSKGMPVIKSPTSTKELAQYCKDQGIPMPSTTAAKEKEFQDWEEQYGDKFPVIRYIQTWRKCNRLVNLYEEMLGRVRPDGRMEFPFAYFGAGNTGRWSGRPGGRSHQGSADKGINMQNLIKDALFFDKDCLFLGQGSAKDAPENTDHTIEFRHRFIAEPGKKFVISDLSQIEPRCAAVLTGDKEFLGACRRTSPYQAHAETTMGWDPSRGDLKKEDAKLYALAKARCLHGTTPILTDRGYFSVSDLFKRGDLMFRLWDGRSWVFCEGVVRTGKKGVQIYGGEFFTKDHRVFTRDGERPVGQIYERGETSELLGRNLPWSDWQDIWFLACFVGRTLANEGWDLCQSRMRRVRECLRSKCQQFAERAINPMSKMWSKTVQENSGFEGMGTGSGQVGSDTTSEMGRDDGSVLSSKFSFISNVRGKGNQSS